MNRLLLTAALMSCAAAHAGGPISLLVPIEYQEGNRVQHKTRDECGLEDRLAADISAEFQRRDARPGTTTSTAGAVLRVAIVTGHGIGGGGWTGGKSLTARADLMNDGTVLRTKQVTGKSHGGLMSRFEGTCDLLNAISKDLAKEIIDWSGTSTDAGFDEQAARAGAGAASQAAPSSDAPASGAQ